MSNNDLENKKCVPCEGGVEPLDMDAAQQRLSSQRHWTERKDGADIITHNNGTIEELISIVNNEIINLKTNHKNKSLTKSKYTQWWESQNN